MEVCLLLAVWWNSTKMSELSANHWSFADESRTILFTRVVVAEWLRRWTRNPLGSPRVGSNPTDYEHCLVDEHSFYKEIAV